MDNYSEILLKNKSLELVRFVLIEGEESQSADQESISRLSRRFV